jgi:hypothetical protein
MYNLVNVPAASEKEIEIQPRVDGQNVMLVRIRKGAPPNQWVRMADTYIGDNLLSRPQALREKIAWEMAYLVQAARDAGYAQAQYEIRQALGIPHR